jgi:rod shape-determining protein MreD
VVLGLQLGLGRHIDFRGAPPNLVLVCAVFIALNAPKQPALWACFGLGLVQDMLSGHSLGLYAFSYAVTGYFILMTREVVYREHPLTHFSLTFASGLVVACVLLVHGLVRLGPDERVPVSMLMTTALYTAALSPILLIPLQQTRRVFSFTATRRRHRG